MSVPDRMWTDAQLDALLELAYESGRTDEAHRIGEAIAELDRCWVERAKLTEEQRVAARIAELGGRAAAVPLRYDNPGWPPVAVPGGGGIRLDPATAPAAPPAVVDLHVVQTRRHDQDSIAVAAQYAPAGGGDPVTAPAAYLAGWRQMRPLLSAPVWQRVWGDLSARTRAGLSDLDPNVLLGRVA